MNWPIGTLGLAKPCRGRPQPTSCSPHPAGAILQAGESSGDGRTESQVVLDSLSAGAAAGDDPCGLRRSRCSEG